MRWLLWFDYVAASTDLALSVQDGDFVFGLHDWQTIFDGFFWHLGVIIVHTLSQVLQCIGCAFLPFDAVCCKQNNYWPCN